MRTSHIIISSLLTLNLLALPQFATMAAEAETIRASVIASPLSEAYDTEGGSSTQSVMIWIDDNTQLTTLAQDLTNTAQTTQYSLRNVDLSLLDTEEIQGLISKKREESKKLYIAQNSAFAD